MEASHPIPGDLPNAWRARATLLRQHGAGDVARTWELAADEIEEAWATLGEDTLSLVDAARISGYCADHLGHLVKTGKIPNAGRTGAPRIRRADLPMKKKGGRGRPTRPHRVPTREDICSIHVSEEEG